MECSCFKAKELFLPADTYQRDLDWTFIKNWIRVPTAVDFAAESAVQHCNQLHNEPVSPVPQNQLNVLI